MSKFFALRSLTSEPACSCGSATSGGRTVDRSGVPDHCAPRLEYDGNTTTTKFGQDRRRVLEGRDRRPPVVSDSEPPAKIDVLQAKSIVPEIEGYRRQRVCRPA